MTDKCEFCGKPWSEHLGIQGTCRLLKIARDELNDMDRQIDMRFKAEFELREMTADRDAWKAKAERYEKALHVMIDEPAFEGFSDDEMDCYEYALDESNGEEWTDAEFFEGFLKMLEAKAARAALQEDTP